MFSQMADFLAVGKLIQKLKLISHEHTHTHEHVPVHSDMDMYTDV